MRSDERDGKGRDTTSLVVHRVVTRLVDRVRTDAPAALEPTIYVPLRRGADLTWKDVAARKV